MDYRHSFRDSRSAQISPDHIIKDFECVDIVVLFIDNYGEMQVMLNNMSTTAATAAEIGSDLSKIGDDKIPILSIITG